MLKLRTRERLESSVNAGSMADIAFLLLIFFLVTTTIAEDKGVLVRLPPWHPDQPITDVNQDNVLSILVNSDDHLLVENKDLSIGDLKGTIKRFIMNPLKESDKPSSPKKAVISIKNDRSTSYEAYLEVYNEVKAAYNELRNEYALSHYQREYKNLAPTLRKVVKIEIPLVISEAEPSDLALLE